MKFLNTRVYNFEKALHGMRNPKNSWNLSDSEYGVCKLNELKDVPDGSQIIAFYSDNSKDKSTARIDETESWIGKINYVEYAKIGPNDMNLAKKLIKAGTEHRKFLRQIMVSVDITAAIYLFKEFDTYKINVTSNSTSTMHKLATTPITLECFEIDDYNSEITKNIETEFNLSGEEIIIKFCEDLRQKYLETKDKRYWKELIRWLPESWLQTRTITMNYENLRNIYHQRNGHKLSEWHEICHWIELLPYAKDFIIN